MESNHFRMNLQLFAEDAGNAADGAAQQNASTAEQTANAPAAEAERTFTQADVDRLINQRIARERRDAEHKIAQARSEARSEAERLAQMSEEQRAEQRRAEAEQAAQQRETQLAQREAEITRRELRAEAIETLAQRGLPRSLADVLRYDSAEACQESIKSIEKSFRAAVQAAVEERLAGSGAPLTRGTGAEKPLGIDEQLAKRLGGARARANSAANDIIAKYMR